MLSAKEREVLRFIQFHENVSVAEVCSEFELSESTARRLFTRLSKEGLVERYHGGVHILKKEILSKSFQERIKKSNIIKRQIAYEACQHVHDGECIIMLGGTTVFSMCEFLTDKNITVITNSMPIFLKLKDYENIKLILLGGLFDRDEMETRGVLTVSSSKQLRADSLFIGAISITAKQGVTTDDMLAVEQYLACCDISDNIYVLAGSSKFVSGGYISVLPLKRITCIVTDKGLKKDVKDEFESRGVNLKTV